MAKRVGKEVSLGVAEAVKLCDVDVVAAYPITPQTHIVEHLSKLHADGDLDCEYIPVESEHSAMSACTGSSAAGARTYTATSSQGLELMHEILYITSSLRLPVVMTVVNRSVSGPISIWNDHSDVMGQRDTGWIQTFVENGQEALDLTYHAFRVAEDERVMLPIMVNMDGFILSHMIEPFEMLEEKEVREYLPEYRTRHRLDVDNPMSMGMVGIPSIYTEAKMAQQKALEAAYGPICEAWDEFGRLFGRHYRPVEIYPEGNDDAELVLISMGSISETAMSWVDGVRAKGVKLKLVRLRLWRPFPARDLLDALAGARAVAVLDRCLSLGARWGPVALEVMSSLYGQESAPAVINPVVGLGGRDVSFEDFDEILRLARAAMEGEAADSCQLIQVRK